MYWYTIANYPFNSWLISLIVQQSLADRWFQKDPTVVSFDNKLQYYFKTIDEVETIPVVKDQECIRLFMGPLASSVKGIETTIDHQLVI